MDASEPTMTWTQYGDLRDAGLVVPKSDADNDPAAHDPNNLIYLAGIYKWFDLTKSERLTVLKNINFTIRKNEFVSLVGQSGSGKSTLMNIIGLLDRPNRGTYYFDGDDVLNVNDVQQADYRSRKIGFVFQNFNLVSRISALKNVELPMVYSGVGKKERRARAEELLERVGMADRMGHLPNELSGGQKQRIAIARALANKPELILADEPTGALDTATGNTVMEIFHSLKADGATLLLITHNLELAQETDRIITILDGAITEDGGEQ